MRHQRRAIRPQGEPARQYRRDTGRLVEMGARVRRRGHPHRDHGARHRRASTHGRSKEGALGAMESRVLKPVLAVYVGLFLLFLYGPFIVLGILSFQQGPEGGPQFPITQWSVFWYRDIFGLTPPSRVAPLPIGVSLFRSLMLAGMTMITSTVLVVIFAQLLWKNFPVQY